MDESLSTAKSELMEPDKFTCHLEALPGEEPEFCLGDICCGIYKRKSLLPTVLLYTLIVILILLLCGCLIYVSQMKSNRESNEESQISDGETSTEDAPSSNRKRPTKKDNQNNKGRSNGEDKIKNTSEEENHNEDDYDESTDCSPNQKANDKSNQVRDSINSIDNTKRNYDDSNEPEIEEKKNTNLKNTEEDNNDNLDLVKLNSNNNLSEKKSPNKQNGLADNLELIGREKNNIGEINKEENYRNWGLVDGIYKNDTNSSETTLPMDNKMSKQTQTDLRAYEIDHLIANSQMNLPTDEDCFQQIVEVQTPSYSSDEENTTLNHNKINEAQTKKDTIETLNLEKIRSNVKDPQPSQDGSLKNVRPDSKYGLEENKGKPNDLAATGEKTSTDTEDANSSIKHHEELSTNNTHMKNHERKTPQSKILTEENRKSERDSSRDSRNIKKGKSLKEMLRRNKDHKELNKSEDLP